MQRDKLTKAKIFTTIQSFKNKNKIVNFSGENIRIGDFYDVEITECLAYSVSGKKIN